MPQYAGLLFEKVMGQCFLKFGTFNYFRVVPLKFKIKTDKKIISNRYFSAS
jgi:hypothetical protein